MFFFYIIIILLNDMADLDVVYGVDVQCTMPFCAALNHS